MEDNKINIIIISLPKNDVEEKELYYTIKQAIEKCSSFKESKIIFERGNYHIKYLKAIEDFDDLMNGELSPDTQWGVDGEPYNSALEFTNCQSIEIEGQGAKLVFHGLIQPFGFINCKKVILRNFTIDWDRAPYSIGRVVAKTFVSMDIQVFKEYPVKGKEPVWCFTDYEPASGRIAEVWNYGSTSPMEYLEDQLIRVRDEKAKDINVGNWIIMQHIGLYRPGIYLLDSANIFMDDITIHGVPGMGVIAHRCKDITLRNFQVRPAAGMLRSINRDAAHFISCTGNIDFEDCYFEAMGDDAVNVHGFYYEVKEILDNNSIKVICGRITQDYACEYPGVGDNVEFTNHKSLLPYASGKINKVNVDKRSKELTLSFKESLPKGFCKEDIIGNSSKVAKLSFRNCTVKDNCARGVLIQTREALVENCLFQNCTGTGVDINTAESWMESIGTRNVIVRNNKFIGCGYSLGNAGNASAVAIRTECEEKVAGVHKAITIEGNLIEGVGINGIYVGCTDGAVIRNNKIYNCSKEVMVEYSKNISIE